MMDDADLTRLREEVTAAPGEGDVLGISRHAALALLDHIATLTARAETAEATVQRVEAECEAAEDHGAHDEVDDAWVEVAVIRAALAAPAQTEGDE